MIKKMFISVIKNINLGQNMPGSDWHRLEADGTVRLLKREAYTQQRDNNDELN